MCHPYGTPRPSFNRPHLVLVGAEQSFRVCLQSFTCRAVSDSLYHPSVLWHIKSGCICWDVVVKLGNDVVSKAQMGLGVCVLMNSLSLKNNSIWEQETTKTQTSLQLCVIINVLFCDLPESRNESQGGRKNSIFSLSHGHPAPQRKAKLAGTSRDSSG